MAVTSDPNKTAKNENLSASDTLVVGDPATVLSELIQELGLTSVTPNWFEAASPQTTMGADTPELLVDRRAMICGAISEVLGRWKSSVLIDDSQMFGGLLSEHYDALPDGLRIFGDHGGFVGAGIAQATGLALSDPKTRVMCTLGDEGFANGLQGLQAAVQETARVLFIVCSNGGAVSLRKQASADHGPAERSYLASADRIRCNVVASAMGISSHRVELPILSSDDEFAAAIDELVAALDAADAVESGPSMVELVLPADPQAWTGIWLEQGLDELERRTD